MVKHATVVLFAIVLFTPAVAAQRQPEQAYRAYLPIIARPRPGPAVCVAWAPGTLIDRARADFGSQSFFHSASYQAWWIEMGGIPVWRSPNQPGAFVDVAAALRQQEDYRGIVLLFNEPDIVGQDGPLAPEDAAALYRLAVRLFPDVTFAVPNANSVWYLERFLEAVGDDLRPGDIIAIHMYQDTDDEPTVWPADWLARVFELADARDNRVMVSEVGVSNNWSAAQQERYISELLASRATAVCWYTPHCGGYSEHACQFNLYDDIDGNPSLTAAGLALQAALAER